VTPTVILHGEYLPLLYLLNRATADLVLGYMQQNAGDASITSSPEHGAWGREMEKLRGAYGHPPTE
jgi:hypothetical protein